MHLVHLTASTFFGGPERQMLGLAQALAGRARTSVLSFAEGGRCEAFIAEAKRRCTFADSLSYDTPRWPKCVSEIAARLRASGADVLFCHGYKSDLLGRRAARRAGIQVVAVSRGWTRESLRVRMYESLDRRKLRRMDAVVAVSARQAAKVRMAGVPADKVVVIRNAARPAAFPPPTIEGRLALAKYAPTPGEFLIVTAARFSPEKGIHVLVDAARRVLARQPSARFLVFGDGVQRNRLERLIEINDVGHAFALAAFCDHLDELLPNADLMVLPSFTEGLPNIVLEASAAGVAVVATAVGGTPECVVEGETGRLVPPRDPVALADAIVGLLDDAELRRRLGGGGHCFVRSHFSFAAQAEQYLQLLDRLGVRGTGMRHAA